MIAALRKSLPYCVVVVAACAASSPPPASRPAPPPPDPLPKAGSLSGAPECVQAMAETRRCFSEHLSGARKTNHGQFSCPEADAWHRADLRLDAMTVTLPTSMSHGWDEPLDCAFIFKAPLTAEQRAALEAVSVKLNDGYGPIEKLAHGSVALSHLYCLAELGIVAQLECEQPGPVLQ